MLWIFAALTKTFVKNRNISENTAIFEFYKVINSDIYCHTSNRKGFDAISLSHMNHFCFSSSSFITSSVCFLILLFLYFPSFPFFLKKQFLPLKFPPLSSFFPLLSLASCSLSKAVQVPGRCCVMEASKMVLFSLRVIRLCGGYAPSTCAHAKFVRALSNIRVVYRPTSPPSRHDSQRVKPCRRRKEGRKEWG